MNNMNKAQIKPIDMEDSKKESYSKTISKNGKTKTIRVDEVENGYIVTLEKEYEDKNNGGWQWDCKKYISVKNPIIDMEGFNSNDGSSETEYNAMMENINKIFS